jgi:hypothetical protein
MGGLSLDPTGCEGTDQQRLASVLPHDLVWIAVDDHESTGWACRKVAELEHTPGCGQVCEPNCGAAWELVSMAGLQARVRGDLVAPRSGVLSLGDVLTLVTLGIGSSCGAIVVDDLGALLAQHPSPGWWEQFAEAADASTADGVPVFLLADPQSLDPWPDGLPKPAWVRRGNGWWLCSRFGTPCGVLQ